VAAVGREMHQRREAKARRRRRRTTSRPAHIPGHPTNDVVPKRTGKGRRQESRQQQSAEMGRGVVAMENVITTLIRETLKSGRSRPQGAGVRRAEEQAERHRAQWVGMPRR
jgi:hypothetical protein